MSVDQIQQQIVLLALFDGTSGQLLKDSALVTTGIVIGPASAHRMRFHCMMELTGKLIKNLHTQRLTSSLETWIPTKTSNTAVVTLEMLRWKVSLIFVL